MERKPELVSDSYQRTVCWRQYPTVAFSGLLLPGPHPHQLSYPKSCLRLPTLRYSSPQLQSRLSLGLHENEQRKHCRRQAAEGGQRQPRWPWSCRPLWSFVVAPSLHSIRDLKCCFHFQMEFLKVKLNALQQKAQMFSCEINGALKNTLHNMIG